MQYVYFISNEKPNEYPVIDKHYTWYPIHSKLSFEEFSEIYHAKPPCAIYTYGSTCIWQYLYTSFRIRKMWIHLNALPIQIIVEPTVFSSVLGHHLDNENPLVSVITSTFHSKEKIQRPLRSLKRQTYTNWEWVVWDDSKDNLTYGDLLQMKKTDLRIRVYKAPEHSGLIGELKRLAAGVSYGSLIVELDHDDDLHPELLQWVVDASKKYKEADFFYCDTCQLYEKTLKCHTYGDYFGFGYGANLNVWSNLFKKWIIQTISAPPNPVTLRHLVGMPNHVRVWRTSFYDKIGKHNPMLSVSDDYDLLVRSYIHGKWCYIAKCGYFQYRNEDGNFTFIRNSLIQHNVKHIYNRYKSKLPPVPDKYQFQPFWKSDEQEFPKTHLVYNPTPHKYSVIMLEPDAEKIKQILDLPESIHIYIVGVCPDIPENLRDKVSWWDLTTDNVDEKLRYMKHISLGEHSVSPEYILELNSNTVLTS